MHTPPKTNLPSSNNDIMSNADRIAAALADLESQVVPNYSATAKKHGVVRTTLMRRYTGKTVSNHEATTEHRQALNATQEKVLLEHVQRLVTRGTPPTPAIVRNFAEEIYGGRLGRCWTTRFIHRHEMHLKTMYLRNIDSLRKKSEYAPYFRLFYELVCKKKMYIPEKKANLY